MIRKISYILPLAAIALIAALFFEFAASTREYRPIGPGADAIVVLTGGRGRTEEGLALLRKGRAKLLILSGVHQDADLDSIFLKRVNSVERGKIVLEKRSGSTFENALEVRKLMEERGIASIVLITSGYHIKRAHYTFMKVMPEGTRIEAYSVVSPNFDESRWWEGGSFGLLAAEFVKYYWYMARFAVFGVPA
ncbi:MAG: hypothetical protein A2052_08925 [Deltaproteobacteria bacterium GWA2_54_12]|nr:MAG: hypothetical protein A2052_08925 [Deltaproteobacteria bacterium GWA2_54_12]